METVKLPQIEVNIKTTADSPSNEEKQWIQVNPSCLLAYLGIRGYANTPNTGIGVINKNALPILTYFDIFKNYYANTQEENFYMIVSASAMVIKVMDYSFGWPLGHALRFTVASCSGLNTASRIL